MELLSQSPNLNKISLYNTASTLALVTVFYNIIEGLFSVFFGLEDETIALFGFGLDSFVEVISGIGIWHMVQRLKQFSSSSPDQFEKRALRITGTAFYILTIGLIIGSAMNIFQGHKPETTFWGIRAKSLLKKQRAMCAVSVEIIALKRNKSCGYASKD